MLKANRCRKGQDKRSWALPLAGAFTYRGGSTIFRVEVEVLDIESPNADTAAPYVSV